MDDKRVFRVEPGDKEILQVASWGSCST